MLFIYRRGPGVSCVLQFGFRADRYNGVVALQDALIMKNMLHSMAVKTHYISSTDGKGQTQTLSVLVYSSKYFLVLVLLGKNLLSVYQRLWKKLTSVHEWREDALRAGRIVLRNYTLLNFAFEVNFLDRWQVSSGKNPSITQKKWFSHGRRYHNMISEY